MRRTPNHTSVLILDDNRDAADSLRDLLALHGYDARAAYDPEAALANGPADVVILEPHLRGVDGWDVARRLRAAGSKPFVVAVTTRGMPRDRVESEAAGVDLHLLKPADPAELVTALRRFARPAAACA